MTQEDLADFAPLPLLRTSLAQTILSMRIPSSVNWIRSVEQPVLLDAGVDQTGYDTEGHVRLLGYYVSAHTASEHTAAERAAEMTVAKSESRGLVMTLHGWCGCSHSPYNMVLTDALVRAGYSVVRLNLRDHGPNIHMRSERLNKGLFLGTLVEEAAAATTRIAEIAGERPFYILGTSMGGNFALRLALWHQQQPIPGLRHVVAVSPVLHPGTSTDALDAHPLYRYYFRRRWLDSLREKQRAFPDTFDISPVEEMASVRVMTEWLVRRYTGYQDADDYFDRYAVDTAAMEHLNVPTTIITARDDRVIPSVGFDALPDHPHLNMHMFDVGGHVGFMDGFPPKHALPPLILSALGNGVLNAPTGSSN